MLDEPVLIPDYLRIGKGFETKRKEETQGK